MTLQTINEARRPANAFTKAKTMTADGYKWNELAKKMYRVFKPENTTQDKADYIVDLMLTHCTCPAFQKDGAICKHVYWIGLELEKRTPQRRRFSNWPRVKLLPPNTMPNAPSANRTD